MSATTEVDATLNDLSTQRRDFLRVGVGVGFAAAVSPIMAQQAIHTDSNGLTAGVVKVAVGHDTIPAYRAKPATGDKFPTVIVVSEIFGVHEHIADLCRRLAKVGYYAIAPEFFIRQGDVSQGSFEHILGVVGKVPDAQVFGDIDAAIKFASADGADVARRAITGFCWGGRIVWLQAQRDAGLKAGVAWYGRLTQGFQAGAKNPIDIASQLQAPVLGLYGGKDEGIPLTDIEKMKAALARGSAASKDSQFVVYPDADHAFNADYRPSYLKSAADDGWKRMLAWFKAHGV